MTFPAPGGTSWVATACYGTPSAEHRLAKDHSSVMLTDNQLIGCQSTILSKLCSLQPCMPSSQTAGLLSAYGIGVQSLIGGEATPTGVFRDGELVKSNMSSTGLAY